MKKLILVSFLWSLRTIAQDVQSSKTYIQTCYHDQQCFSLNSSSFIFYNPDNHELIIKMDLKKFKTTDKVEIAHAQFMIHDMRVDAGEQLEEAVYRLVQL